MSELNIVLIQTASALEPGDNRERLASSLELLAAGSDPMPELVVFPEAFQRDFGQPGSDISAYAEELDGDFVRKVGELASKHGTTVVAGMFERSEDPERPYNTLVVVDRDGLRATYRKIHLYDSFGYRESERLLAGRIEPVLVDVGGFRVGLMTCYDLRFPELSRRLTEQGAELLVVPAAWVAGPRKVDHWRTLVTARAIENTAYVAAAGQPGPRYAGNSMVVSPMGDLCSEPAGEDEAIVRATISREVLEESRTQNPSLANRRF